MQQVAARIAKTWERNRKESKFERYLFSAVLIFCLSGSMFSPPVIVVVESPKVWFSQPKVRLPQARQ